MDGKKKRIAKYIGMVNKKILEQSVKMWDKHFDEIDSSYDRTTPFEKPPQGIKHILNLYYKDREKKLEMEEISKSSLRFANENMPIFWKWYKKEYGDKLIEKITTTEIQNYRTFIKTKGWANQTISIRLRAVRTFFKWCIDEKYIETTPFTSEINIPKYQQKKDDEVPMGDDWQRLYDFIENSLTFTPTPPQLKKNVKVGERKTIKRKWDWFNNQKDFKYMVWTILNTGMRAGEIRELKWKKGKLDTTEKATSYSCFDRTKTKFQIYWKGSYGEIPVPIKLKPMFDELEKKKQKGDVYVWNTRKDGVDPFYSKSVFNKQFRRLMKGLGLVEQNEDGGEDVLYTPHSLRHGVVADLLDKNTNIYTIQKLLRHSDIRTTLNIYGHLMPNKLTEVMDIIGQDIKVVQNRMIEEGKVVNREWIDDFNNN